MAALDTLLNTITNMTAPPRRVRKLLSEEKSKYSYAADRYSF
jgi:hypothetical protein